MVRFAWSLLLVSMLLSPAYGAEVRLLTLADIEQMGGTDFDGGVGDYLLLSDQIEAVVLAIGATPDFDILYTPGSLPSRGVLIDIGTRGDRNDQFDELHQALNMEYIQCPSGTSGSCQPDSGFDQNLIEYFGPEGGFPEPLFVNDGATASITVYGRAALNYDGVTGTLPVTTTYSVTDGNPWVDIYTQVANNGDEALPAFTISDIDVIANRGRQVFQPFPDLGSLPRSSLPLALQWDYLVSLGTNGPEDGPVNNDGTPAGEVCYGYMSVDPPGPMVGWAINAANTPSRYFDLDTMNSGSPPMLASGAVLTYWRRLVVGTKNTVDACLRIMDDDLYSHGSAVFRGRIIDGLGNPLPEAHIFFDNMMDAPGSPAYPTSLATAEGSRLPTSHTVTSATGHFDVALPALVDPTVTPSIYTATVKAEGHATYELDRLFIVDPAAIADSPLKLGDIDIVSRTGWLDYTVLAKFPTGEPVATPVKLSIYGTGATPNPDFGSQYLSLRDFPGLDPLAGGSSSNLGETFASQSALNFAMDVDGAGLLEMKPGTYMVYASRGLEYTIASAPFTIAPGTTTVLDPLIIGPVVSSARVASIDAHVHGVKSPDNSTPLSYRVISYLAAGIEFIVGTDHDYVTDYSPVITDLNLDHEIRAITGLELSGRFSVPPGPDTGFIDAWPLGIGHWNAWPLSSIPSARRGGAVQDEYINPGTAVDRLRGMDSLPLLGAEPSTATLEQWLAAIQAGQPGTPGEDLPVDDELVVLNHPRAGGTGMFETLASLDGGYQADMPITDFPNSLVGLPSLYHSDNVGPGGTDTNGFSFDAMELLNGNNFDTYQATRADWFGLLDQGIHKTGIANSDSHRIVLDNPGIGRTYIFHDGANSLDLETQEIVDNLKAMRAIGSAGPMLRAGVRGDDVDDAPLDRYFNTIGETIVATGKSVAIQIRVEAPPWIPVEEVRIFSNGCEVATLPIRDDKVVGGKVLRFLQEVELEGIASDAYLTVEAGVIVEDDSCVNMGTCESCVNTEGCAETMKLILPNFDGPFAFTNPIFVDRNGNGYKPPGIGADCPEKFSYSVPAEKEPVFIFDIDL